MAVFFHAPNTYTSRNVLELHVHSGRAVTSAVLSALSHIPTLRPAEPGEFNRWAFESGRIDMTEAEGIRDLVDAETDVRRKLALRSATVIHICLTAKYLSLQQKLTLSSYQRPSG
ncbi:hypothetical protein BS47DRAFT_1342877, partial [Hydnum rufescens UP504]